MVRFINRNGSRASKAVENDTPSSIPVSLTRSLSELRLSHATLLEEHGASMALLRRREAEMSDAERREADSRKVIEALQSEVRVLKENAQRGEQRVALAEREVGFLQALVVSMIHRCVEVLLTNVIRRASMQRKTYKRTLSLMSQKRNGYNTSKLFLKSTKPPTPNFWSNSMERPRNPHS